MAKRLIDLNGLVLEYVGLAKISPYDYVGICKYFANQLINSPIVDAVEVCYCKDCKFWEKQKDSAQGCCLLSGNYPTGGWYCADGKRRDEGG